MLRLLQVAALLLIPALDDQAPGAGQSAECDESLAERHKRELDEHNERVKASQQAQASSAGETSGKQPEGSVPVSPLTPSVSTTAGAASSAGEFEAQRRIAGEATAADLGRHKTAVASGADVAPLGPKDAGSLNPAGVPAPTLKDKVEQVWVRFKQMAHIPPGRTIRAGEVGQIPADHVHPDVHDVLDEDDPAIPGNATTDQDEPAPPAEPAAGQSHIDWLHQRLSRIEEELFGSAQPSHAPPPPPAPRQDPDTVDHVSV